MNTASLAAAILALVFPVFAQTPPQSSLSYNNKYDNATLPVSELACAILLENRGYTTLGSLLDFPFAGGAYTVVPWNTSTCDTCYTLTYGNTSIYMSAVDTAPNGLNFSISEAAMNALTDGLAAELGRVNVGAVQVDAAYCGF